MSPIVSPDKKKKSNGDSIFKIEDVLEPIIDVYDCSHCGEVFSTLAEVEGSELMEKTFQAAQLTHERFLTIEHSCKIFLYLPN